VNLSLRIVASDFDGDLIEPLKDRSAVQRGSRHSERAPEGGCNAKNRN
jgi:hypothetical protein